MLLKAKTTLTKCSSGTTKKAGCPLAWRYKLLKLKGVFK
jgi:hypothetical protein